MHHIARPWEWGDDGKRYFYCDDPRCDVVYFAEDGTSISKPQLRPASRVKQTGDDAQWCYCFGISRGEVARDPKLKDYVIEQTKQGVCSCETTNPSGRCCLRFPPA